MTQDEDKQYPKKTKSDVSDSWSQQNGTGEKNVFGSESFKVPKKPVKVGNEFTQKFEDHYTNARIKISGQKVKISAKKLIYSGEQKKTRPTEDQLDEAKKNFIRDLQQMRGDGVLTELPPREDIVVTCNPYPDIRVFTTTDKLDIAALDALKPRSQNEFGPTRKA